MKGSRYQIWICAILLVCLTACLGQRQPVAKKYRALACPDFGSDSKSTYQNSNAKKIYSWGGLTVRNTGALYHANNAYPAGMLTATEINDFAKWDLWEDISTNTLSMFSSNWSILPKDRITVLVSNNNRPVHNAVVQLFDSNDAEIWRTISDNTGRAELWVNMFGDDQAAAYLTVQKDGQSSKLNMPVTFNNGVNHCELSTECEVSNQVDLLLVVDATASMVDEINHLKSELTDIVQQVVTQNPNLEMNLGSMFYKCKGNSYTTLRSDFTADIDSTVNFIRKQSASEGGDEAVEVALDEAINLYKWNSQANARLLLLVLDEAPNDTTDNLLKQNILDAAKKGIKIIPVVASGVNGTKDKSLEYLMRCMALATGGTNAFLTDDSGIGNSHTAPTTDKMDVELFNELLIRVISQYAYIPDCNQDIAVLDSTMTDTSRIEMETLEMVVQDTVVDATSDEMAFQFENSDTINFDSSSNEKDILDNIVYVKNQVKFYPNPVSTKLNISSSFEVDYIFVFDSNGKILERKIFNAKDGSIDLSRCCNGQYYVGCLYNEKWYKSKIVVVH